MTEWTVPAVPPASLLCSCHVDALTKYRAPKGWKDNSQYIFIGRPTKAETLSDVSGAPGYFSNPFHIGRDGDREQVVFRYEHWARQRLTEDAVFRQEVKALHGKTLVCHCTPYPCHGAILLKLCEEIQDYPE